MRNPFKPAPAPAPKSEPAPERGHINRSVLCGCCWANRTTSDVCHDCANGACQH